MTKLVTILGGFGFVGRHVARRMAQAGWRVRVATRRPNENLFVRTYGVVGQVEPVLCNIRDDASVRAVIAGADAVVNCAGIYRGRQEHLQGGDRRRRGSRRAAGGRGGRGASGACVGAGRRCRVGQRLCPRQGRRRSRRAGCVPGCSNLAPC